MNAPAFEAISQSLGTILLGLQVRSSALLVFGSSAVFLLRRRAPEVKHFICHAVLYGLLFLPILEFAIPPQPHPLAALTKAELAMFPEQTAAVKTTNIKSETTITVIPFRGSHRIPWKALITPLYLLLAGSLLLRLLLNLRFLSGLLRRSEVVFDADLHDLAREVWLQSLSHYRPQLRVSDSVRVPMAIGFGEMVILLPTSWKTWRPEKLRAVLVHEMAHVRRDDPQTILLASLAVCLFWPNPLVYWLRRRLTEEAEHTCDQAALEELEPCDYARILIEFANDVGRKASRLAGASAVTARRSLMKKRLEHIFSQSGQKGGNLVFKAALIAFFVPALYLTASARLVQESVVSATNSAPVLSIGTQQQADQLESQLMQDPGNLKVRSALMAYYANQRDSSAFTRHMLWMVEHNPEAPAAAMAIYPRSSSSIVEALTAHSISVRDYEQIKAAWENALSRFPNSAQVNLHAGLFLERSDAKRALHLFNQAKGLAPAGSTQADQPYESATSAIATIYAAAFMTDLNSGSARGRVNDIAMGERLARTLTSDLEASTDPALLSQVGTTLVHLRQDEKGLSLIQRAINLDSNNPQWREALESAKAEPIRRQTLERLPTGQLLPAVRIGGQVAEANLITKVDPAYPALALQARISGLVEYSVEIGPDGKIQSLQLIGGHPLLVNAAKDAVLQRVYRPTLLNGKPVTVMTTVDVLFILPPQ